MTKEKNIILGVSASIAIYKACELVRLLKRSSFSVTVVETPESCELIRPIVFQSLSGNKVYSGLFQTPEAWDIEHVSIAKKADLILLAPATANLIAKISAGICDDFLTCVVSATLAPVLIAPAMNDKMYLNKITQRNIQDLKSLGYKFVEPKKGKLACDDIGVGCLAELDTIVQETRKLVLERP